ncbi:hypothetical protein DPEC_G00009750 [Dallia pectoralis]|uniref:Uncharacterized protein n=1 Tax=Dallia pectoralis TaxID=75939 RepID=A0ACC2HKW3_DALPE|nr:hypothetical protein DPEC_G00009750 [Dallia pectoralis]
MSWKGESGRNSWQKECHPSAILPGPPDVECSSTAGMLMNLHWVPVKERTDFKGLLFTLKALHDSDRRYLPQFLQNHSHIPPSVGS